MRAADSILKILQKNVEGDFAFSHLQYINHEAAYEMRGGCSMTGHRLPSWAKGSPLRFFHAADRFERANGERYKEIVFSLPNELPVEKSKEILDRFLGKHFKDHYYAWAIHEKVGSMSDGERHPHVHLMFSTREIDAAEREQERSPELFFKRANKKDPRLGGCAKAARWTGKGRREHLLGLREDFARMQNEVLEKHGVPARVSHLSLEMQRMQAEARGDFVLAEILDRMPQSATHPISIVRDDDVVRQQKQLRRFNDRRLDAIMRRELGRDAKQAKEAARALASATRMADSLSLENVAQYSEEERKELASLRQAMEDARREAEVAQTLVTWGKDALESARLDCLGEEGREAWESAMRLRKGLHEAKDFWRSLSLPEDASEDEDLAMAELEVAMQDRIAGLSREYKAAAKKLQPHLARLAARGTHKNIQARVHEYLFEAKLPKARYMKRLKEFEGAARKMQRRLDEVSARFALSGSQGSLREDLSLTLEEAALVLRHARTHAEGRALKKAEELREARKEVLSYERIIKIAENIFEKGGVKALRERERKLAKQEGYYQNDTGKWLAEARAFKQRPKPGLLSFGDAKAGYEKARQDLLDRQAELNERGDRLDAERRECERIRGEIEARRETPEAERQIQKIAIGVMQKNRPAVEKVKRLTAELSSLREEREEARERVAAVDAGRKEGKGERYRALPPSGGPAPTRMDNARAIADSLRGLRYASLIAKGKDDDSLAGNWNLVSEMDKDEMLEEQARGR